MLLQALSHLSVGHKVLYVSGEESGEQVALRARRLGLDTRGLQLMAEINLERILSTLQAEMPTVAVIDSIQTLWSINSSSAPGSVAQVRECAAQLTRLAKQVGITVILVGHVTKEGALAGPRARTHRRYRALFRGRHPFQLPPGARFKNRFGAVNELGVFAMTETGLKGSATLRLVPVAARPGCAGFLRDGDAGGTPLLVEIQALVDTAHGNPRRLTVGLEAQRLAMLLAVLHRHAGIVCFDQDVFVNAVGGSKITEPAADWQCCFRFHHH